MSKRTAEQLIAASALVKKRRAAEWRFRAYGIAAIAFCFLAILVLFSSIISKGYSAFQQTHITLPVTFDASAIDPDGKKDQTAFRHGMEHCRSHRRARPRPVR